MNHWRLVGQLPLLLIVLIVPPIVEQLLLDRFPRLGGSYVRTFIVVPVALLLWWAASVALSKVDRAKAEIRDFISDLTLHNRPMVRMLIAIVLVGVVYLYVGVVWVNFPPAQLPGHGSVASSAPDPSPLMSVHLPLPKSLPAPEIVENRRPRPPRWNQPEPERARIENLIAQLPIEARAEDETAPHLVIVRVPPSAPTSVQVRP